MSNEPKKTPTKRHRAESTEIGGRSKSIKVVVTYEEQRHLVRVYTADFDTVKATVIGALEALEK